MEALRKKIREEGRVTENDILKVDAFLNHQLDVAFLNEIGKEFRRIFADRTFTKILTIEASGIAIASIVAQYFGVPVLFAKKSRSQNIDGDTFRSEVTSYTYEKKAFTITVSKKFLNENDKVLIIDDFLAEGNALKGLIDVVKQSNAHVEAIGIVIEKAYQSGGKTLRAEGFDIVSLARIAEMKNGSLTFVEDEEE